jgi:hypothetical protein
MSCRLQNHFLFHRLRELSGISVQGLYAHKWDEITLSYGLCAYLETHQVNFHWQDGQGSFLFRFLSGTL